jgi:LmbE family N-acetylglucosaminyl deacetylase
MKRLRLVLLLLSSLAVLRADSISQTGDATRSLRVLLVVAHPDDEYEMAGTVYRIAKELSGTVDQLIVTDGEAGYHYSSLAERYYGIGLTEESEGRKRLPQIRKEEAQRAARILGIRHQLFLNEKDERFTLSAQEVLEKGWHTKRVLEAIEQRLRKGQYDYVIVLLPTADTHGAHKAASILALEAAKQLPEKERPIVLGARASESNSDFYQPLAQYPITATVTPDSRLHFDRDAHFGYQNSLTYRIVVDWVIAEHKSQGLFQNRCQQDRFENFWSFQVSPVAPDSENARLFSGLLTRATSETSAGSAGPARAP